MPVYEYGCKECSSHYDLWQKFSEKPIIICPFCLGKVYRVIQPTPVIFKGKGFYSTDKGRD